MIIRNLVVSWGTYDWVKFCVIPVLRNPSIFEVVIVCRDGMKQIKNCNVTLCEGALYAQRSYDLFQIGTKLGLPKLTNLLFEEDNINVGKLTAQLQLKIILSGIKRVYFSYSKILLNILSEINKKFNIELYSFGNGTDLSRNHFALVPNETEKKKKIDLLEMCVGDYNDTHIKDFELLHQIHAQGG